MTTRFSSLAPFATLACLGLLAVGCEPVEEGGSQDDVLDTAELEMTVDSALEGVDDELVEDATDIEEVGEPEEDVIERTARRAAIRQLVLRAAETEPCAIRGVVAGRYHAVDEELRADGVFRGRAWRRGRELVAAGRGVYAASDEAPGGNFLGAYENLDGDTGTVEGRYLPATEEADRNYGTFHGLWTPDEAEERSGNLRGFWHPMTIVAWVSSSAIGVVATSSPATIDPRRAEAASPGRPAAGDRVRDGNGLESL